MFNVTPYTAEYHSLVANAEGKLRDQWTRCQIVGIDATQDTIRYIIEVRDDDGTFGLERADTIRKLPKPVG